MGNAVLPMGIFGLNHLHHIARMNVFTSFITARDVHDLLVVHEVLIDMAQCRIREETFCG
ncbi:hypothetical protein D3C72_2165200 [compost metagenome]